MLSLDNLINLITKLLMVAPKFLFSFLSKLLDVDEKYIENELSLTELTEICIKFWREKKVRKFFRPNEASNKKYNDPNWLQEIIVVCNKIGISKSELLNNYYVDEIPIIFDKYVELNKTTNKDEIEVSAEDF